MDDDFPDFNKPFLICPPDAICLGCGRPMNTHDAISCMRGNRPDQRHPPSDAMSNEQGKPVTRIEVPSDFWGRADQVFGELEGYAAVCVWCGHGYDIFTPETEDQHFAHNCPDAPEQLKKTALARLAADR
jgi:hypothetical protein